VNRPVMRTTLIAATALWAACSSGGGDPVRVAVRLALDVESCTTDSADQIRLDCASTAGIWLRNAASGADLGHACVDLGDGQSLSGMASLLPRIDLEAGGGGQVTVEVAVYGEWMASDGCPAPDELPDTGGPVVIAQGASEPVGLDDAGEGIPVALECRPESLASREELEQGAACVMGCESAQRECDRGDHIIPCFATDGPDDEWFDCVDSGCLDLDCAANCEPTDEPCNLACVDQACGDACEVSAGLRECLEAFPEGACELCWYDCEYDDVPCQTACEQGFVACTGMICSEQHSTCLAACPGTGGTCASVTGG
jgi:hypothetical protein